MKRPALAFCGVLAALAPAVAQAPPAPSSAAQAAAPAPAPAPAPADLLFEGLHWQAATPGTVLVYRYARATGDPAALGAGFEDRFRLTAEAGEKPETRTVRVEMFSVPERRRAAGPFEDTSGNPVLILFLEHHLETIAKVLKANPRYLKNAIRAGLRDKAAIAPTTIDHKGQSVPAWRVTMQPFLDDPQKGRMRGLEGLTYTFVASQTVPGTIVSIEARATATEGGRLLEETLTYVPDAS